MNGDRGSERLVDILFSEGYSFRLATNTFQQLTDNVNLQLQDDRIEIVHADESSTCLIKISVVTNDLLRYWYKHTPGQTLLVGFKTSEFTNAVKNVHRKNGLLMYVDNSTIGSVCVCPTIESGQPASASIVTTSDVGYHEYDLPAFERADNDPNVRLNAVDWGAFCKQVGSLRCPHVIIFAYPKGVLMVGVSAEKKAAHIIPFGEGVPPKSEADNLIARVYGGVRVPSATQMMGRLEIVGDEQRDTLEYIRLSRDTVKNFSKINGISPSNVPIRLYIQTTNGRTMMKIESKLGSYGTFTVYIKDSQL